MKKRNIAKNIFILAFAFVFILQIKSLGFYTENVIQEAEYTEEYRKWLNLSEEEKQNTVTPRKYEIRVSDNTNYYAIRKNFRAQLAPSRLSNSNYRRYDLREHINVQVKDQQSTGQCWVISTNSAIESNIEKITSETSPLFSARYAEYATAKTFLDGINENPYNREAGGGGFTEIALGLYTSGRGPVLEEDMPFENNENRISISNIQNLETQKQIKEYVRFPSIYKTYSNGKVTYKDASNNIYTQIQVEAIRNKIKEHIINYGAVTSQTYGVGGISANARKYYNNPSNVLSSTAYFCDNSFEMAEHQITIIGWDDDYEISNFNENHRPSSPGAYIVLNSWGEDFGENGVYYISYEDCFIERDVLGIISTVDLDYDNIYQHDELGNNEVLAMRGDSYGANVFEREDTSKSEWLTEISISNLVDTKCEIYVNSKNGELTSKNLKKVESNIEFKNGYHTIKLKNPIELTGNKFVVAVKYIADETKNSHIGLESPDKNYWATANAKLGQSYVSVDLDNWDDIVELASTTVIPENSNLCIKAFTKEKTEDLKFFRVNNYDMDAEYIYNISPGTNLYELSNNISTNMEYYIYDKAGNTIQDNQVLSTGMILENELGNYKIVVKGDLTGTGKVTITDVVKIKLHTSKIKFLKNEFLKAADVNGDNKVTITDLVIINLASVGIRKI